jgi:ZIP family zinc transporter
MTLSPAFAVLLPIIATLLGGLAVLRSPRNLVPWLSLSGGVILGLAFLDLLPESFSSAIDAGLDPIWIGCAALGSILFFHLLDKTFDYHGHEGHEHSHHVHKHIGTWTRVGGMGFHAFLDGLAVGGGFAAGNRLGLLVTIALMLHKFTDGLSTVTILRMRHGQNRPAILGLAMILILPVIGFFAGHAITPDSHYLSLFLAALAGLFIHLSLSELLPSAHEEKTSRLGLGLTALGIALMLFVNIVAPG